MKIGKLNELLNTEFGIGFVGSDLKMKCDTCGVPTRGERILVKWDVIRDAALFININFDDSCFTDRVVLSLGEDTVISELALYCDGTLVYNKNDMHAVGSFEIEAGVRAKSLRIILSCDYTDLDINAIDVYGALYDGCDIFPTPACISISGGSAPVSSFAAYFADSADGKRAGEILSEKYFEKTGVTLTYSDDGNVRFVTDASVPADGCDVEVTDSAITVTASNLRGFVYGAEQVIKLIKGDRLTLAKITDKPRFPFRGVHLYVPSKENIGFTKRLVKYLLSPMGYNTIIMEIAGTGMKFDTHPEITKLVCDAVQKGKDGKMPPFPHGGVAEGKPLEKSELRELLTYIRSFGIEVIPEVQSLGHVQFMTYAHPDIAEIDPEKPKAVDTRLEDALPADVYPHCYCPSNEKSYEILFDLLDEIIEVFEPREYVHMGHDEVYQLGVCPICRTKSRDKLLADDINRIYDHLKARGLKMMIWGDMLQPVARYKTHGAMDLIPKDIVLLDFIWYFHLDKDIEDNLLEKGFKVAFGNLYSSHFPRYESRSNKDGIIGGQVSAWSATAEHNLQREGKLYDFLMTAQMLWSADYSHNYTFTYDKMISERMRGLREDLRGLRYPTGKTEPLALDTDVKSNPSSIVFYHAQRHRFTRMPWKEHDIIGHYLLTYADGSTEKLPIASGKNIEYVHRRPNVSLKHKLYRHNGYTACYESDGILSFTEDGKPYVLYRYEYILPKKIRKVELVCDGKFSDNIILDKIEGVCKE